MKAHAKNHQAGFTLIEYIVALVIAAIIAAMVSTYFGTALTQSGVPIQRLQKASNLHQVMENIVADYNRLNALNLRYKWRASKPYRIGSVVVPTTSNGYYYKCTAAGTSGATEPTWSINGPETDGGVTWQESGNIVWQTSHSYSANAIMIPIVNNGHYYRCTTIGTSSASIPIPWRPSKSYSVGDVVVATLFNGRNYRCTVAGTSGTPEPTWPTVAGGTVTNGTVTWQEVPDGTVRWTEVGTILSSNEETIENLFTLLPAVNGTNTRYGTGYTVAEKVFIRFNPGSSPPNQADTEVTENNILKVTIKSNDTNETLTQLFTIR